MASEGKSSRKRRWQLAGAALACLVAAFGIFLAWAHRPAIAEQAPPARASFSPVLVEHGRRLAMVGNCVSCHQRADGRPYAGGYGVKSPFGTIFGSNITPDPGTGIGRWSAAAFRRAMREGVSRDGHLLYPAFPYTHFTALRDVDLDALYAFLMTRDAVHYSPPANRLIPLLGFRPLMAGWNLLFFRPAPFRADPAHDARWNRGAYLGEALAHCGGCHTPRGLLGQEKTGKAGAGGWSDGWYAPPINAASPAVRAWTPARMAEYLSTGLSPSHAASAGPMGSVAHNLARASAPDVAALSAYYSWQMRAAPAARAEPPLPDRERAAARAYPAGAALFAGACAACHGAGAPMMAHGRPPLPLGTPFHENNPRDAIAIVLRGLAPPVKAAGPYMPAFADQLTDGQIADVTGYLHARYGTGPEWRDLPAEVAKARKATAR